MDTLVPTFSKHTLPLNASWLYFCGSDHYCIYHIYNIWAWILLDYSSESPGSVPFWGWFGLVFHPRASLWYQRIAPLRPVSPLGDVCSHESNLGL